MVKIGRKPLFIGLLGGTAGTSGTANTTRTTRTAKTAGTAKTAEKNFSAIRGKPYRSSQVGFARIKGQRRTSGIQRVTTADEARYSAGHPGTSGRQRYTRRKTNPAHPLKSTLCEMEQGETKYTRSTQGCTQGLDGRVVRARFPGWGREDMVRPGPRHDGKGGIDGTDGTCHGTRRHKRRQGMDKLEFVQGFVPFVCRQGLDKQLHKQRIDGNILDLLINIRG